MIYRDGITEIVPLEDNEFFRNRFGWYQGWWNDPDVTRFTSHGQYPKSKRELEEYLSINDNADQIVWAILDTTEENHHWIGNVSLQQIDWQNRSAEVAIIIGLTKFNGRGHGTRVLTMVLDHARRKMGLHRVWAGTAQENQGFQKAALRAGMTHEGRERQAMWCDGHWMSIEKFAKVWND